MLRDIVTGYQEGGADYIYALLTGYADKPPAYRRDNRPPEAGRGQGRQGRESRRALRIASRRAKPARRTSATSCRTACTTTSTSPAARSPCRRRWRRGEVRSRRRRAVDGRQNAKDLAAFLSWTADPKLSERKRLGWQVMLYLLITSSCSISPRSGSGRPCTKPFPTREIEAK